MLGFAWGSALQAFLVVGVAGCSGVDEHAASMLLPDGTVALSHATLITDSLRGDSLLSTAVIGDPRFMAITGSTLWVSDRSGDPYLHLIDIANDSFLESRGRTGEGPADYGEVPQLTIRPGDSTGVWAYDARFHRLTREPISRDEDAHVVPFFEGKLQSAYSLQWRDNRNLVGIGDMDTNRIILTDIAGDDMVLVPNALLGPDSASLDARRAISSGYSMCVQPGAGRTALLYLAAGQVDIYDASGEHLGRADVPFASDGEWVINRRGVLWFKVDWNYYVGCAATERFLFALFAGQRIDGPAGPGARRALHLHVFDWSGELRAVWALDRPVSVITVVGDTTMYASGQDGVGLYRFALPALP